MDKKIQDALDLIENEIELKIEMMEGVEIDNLKEKKEKISKLEKIINDCYEIGSQNPATELQHEKAQLEDEVKELSQTYDDLDDLYNTLKAMTKRLEENLKSKPDGKPLNENLGVNHKPRKKGRRGNENLEDYLLPVIKLIKDGNDYISAFHQLAEKLDVTYQTVNAQCTRQLGIKTDEFVRDVRDGKIIDLLKRKFPEQSEMIEETLREYY
jgi:hypothetical protein